MIEIVVTIWIIIFHVFLRQITLIVVKLAIKFMFLTVTRLNMT
jgi:hypothetical protein